MIKRFLFRWSTGDGAALFKTIFNIQINESHLRLLQIYWNIHLIGNYLLVYTANITRCGPKRALKFTNQRKEIQKATSKHTSGKRRKTESVCTISNLTLKAIYFLSWNKLCCISINTYKVHLSWDYSSSTAMLLIFLYWKIENVWYEV